MSGFRLALCAAMLFVVTAIAFAQTGLPPDTSDVRSEYAEIAVSLLRDLTRLPTTIHESRGGTDTLVTVEQNSDHVYLLFVPERDGEFPIDTAGTYILRRRRSDGEIDQLKIFLRSDSRFFVRIWPETSQRSTMSVYLAGAPIALSIPVPLGIETILAQPLDLLFRSAEARVDWSLFYPETDLSEYQLVEWMADTTRSMLHTLPDADDGAMDEDGNLVFIESLVLQDQGAGFNCSGFAKWVVDGLHMGLFGSYLSIDQLKEKHLDLRGNEWSQAHEDDRDPYFGLDWTRNLATAMMSSREGGREIDPESADVRSVPFAEYVEDVGYPVARLEQLMYLLAIREPGYIYLASFNEEFGERPVLHQHVHVAVLFPYFDEHGEFQVDVMERNVEASTKSLLRRYGEDSVHLVRVRADYSYTPPLIRD
jgi:hypothetical protein